MQPNIRQFEFPEMTVAPGRAMVGLPTIEQLVLFWVWSFNNIRVKDLSVDILTDACGVADPRRVRKALFGLSEKGLLVIAPETFFTDSAKPDAFQTSISLELPISRAYAGVGTSSLSSTKTFVPSVSGVFSLHSPENPKGQSAKVRADSQNQGEISLEKNIPDSTETVLAHWNQIAIRMKFPRCFKMTEFRRTHILARLEDHPQMAWEVLWKSLEKSPQLAKESWFDFDWFISSEKNFDRVARGWLSWKTERNRPPGSAPVDEGHETTYDRLRRRRLTSDSLLELTTVD